MTSSRIPKAAATPAVKAALIRQAVLQLQEARDLLVRADEPSCLDAVQKIGGAIRAASHSQQRVIEAGARLLPAILLVLVIPFLSVSCADRVLSPEGCEAWERPDTTYLATQTGTRGAALVRCLPFRNP